MKASRSKLFSAQDPESNAGKSYSSLYALNPEARTIQTIETQNWVWLGTKVLHFTWKTSLILITKITATGFTSTQIAPPILTNVFQLQATNHSSEHKKHAKVGVQEDTHSMQGETHTHMATPDDMVSISTDSSKKDYRNNS